MQYTVTKRRLAYHECVFGPLAARLMSSSALCYYSREDISGLVCVYMFILCMQCVRNENENGNERGDASVCESAEYFSICFSYVCVCVWMERWNGYRSGSPRITRQTSRYVLHPTRREHDHYARICAHHSLAPRRAIYCILARTAAMDKPREIYLSAYCRRARECVSVWVWGRLLPAINVRSVWEKNPIRSLPRRFFKKKKVERILFFNWLWGLFVFA